MGTKRIQQPIIVASTKEEEIILLSKLTDLEKFCLDGYILSDEKDTEKVMKAYLLSRPKDSTANKQAVYVQARRWVNLDKCQAYIKAKKERIILVQDGSNDEDGDVMRSKDDLIKLINKFISQAERSNDAKTVDSLVKNLTALQQLNKQDSDDKESQIKYFMPLKCSQCDLYKTAKMTNISTKNTDS